VEVSDKDVRGDHGPLGCHLCECVSGFVVFPQHMVEFVVIETFFLGVRLPCSMCPSWDHGNLTLS